MVDALKNKMEKLRADMFEATSNADQSEETVKAVEERCSRHDGDIQELEERLNVLEDDLDKAETVSKEQIQSLENQLREWDQRASAGEGRVRSLQGEKEKLERNLEDIRSEKTKVLSELESLGLSLDD
jgi:predicted  nucleic acid-binding Zn-ribbon protein